MVDTGLLSFSNCRAIRWSLLELSCYSLDPSRLLSHKKGTRYRYYVSPALVRGNRRQAPRGRLVPAGDLERLVEERLRQFLHSDAEVYGAIEPMVEGVNDRTEVVARAADLARRWPDIAPTARREILATLVDRIDLMRDRWRRDRFDGRPRRSVARQAHRFRRG
jgi:hypothetical protein